MTTPIRRRVSAVLADRGSLVSAHEHAGSELMYHHAEAEHRYRQSVDELMDLLSALEHRHLGRPGSAVGALILPMPYYRQFKPPHAPVDPATCSAVIRERNLRLLDDCAAHRARHDHGGSLPMAALMVDPFRDARDFASDYAGRRDEVFALKWHPPASDTPVERIVAAGYLELAAAWDLPTVTHCSPEGRLGDLAELTRDAVPEVARLGVRMAIAHLGFLNPGLEEVLGAPGIFADLGPWEAVCERTLGAPPPVAEDRRLAALIARHADRLMFSLDTPWHLQPWDDGRVLGATVPEAMERIRAAQRLAGTPDDGALLAGNTLGFLFGSHRGAA
ncbi:hypothetical protein [Actinacidiphila glaucinigra]|uniref:hypothetical protein n=1 Tax=Actinacidiphila glaucinigra TaxID=235986 RepID=UPI0036E0461E